jgi:hypothetical protein
LIAPWLEWTSARNSLAEAKQKHWETLQILSDLPLRKKDASMNLPPRWRAGLRH